ncbi:MAG: SH3 domain-containing protein [Thermodesulfobacteriota bacterium]
MRFSRIFFAAALFVCLLAQTGTAGEVGTVIKADKIRAEPFLDAKAVGSLTAGSQVNIVKRKGGWLLLSSPKKGWVRMLSIRKGISASAPRPRLSGVAALASGRAGTGKVVSSTGIRGLNEENLKSAHFNEEELKLAESYAASKKDAEQFAATARLKSRKVDYLSK